MLHPVGQHAAVQGSTAREISGLPLSPTLGPAKAMPGSGGLTFLSLNKSMEEGIHNMSPERQILTTLSLDSGALSDGDDGGE